MIRVGFVLGNNQGGINGHISCLKFQQTSLVIFYLSIVTSWLYRTVLEELNRRIVVCGRNLNSVMLGVLSQYILIDGLIGINGKSLDLVATNIQCILRCFRIQPKTVSVGIQILVCIVKRQCINCYNIASGYIFFVNKQVS